jgi:hypothetical protein
MIWKRWKYLNLPKVPFASFPEVVAPIYEEINKLYGTDYKPGPFERILIPGTNSFHRKLKSTRV